MAEIPTNSWKLLYETGRQALRDPEASTGRAVFSAALQLPRISPPAIRARRNARRSRAPLAAAALSRRGGTVTACWSAGRTLGPTHVQVAGV
jgi:hypothetical protein